MTTRYYYDGWRVLAEVEGAGATQRNYANGNGLDEVLCRMDNSTADYYMAHDHLNSVAALLDSAGAVVERYEYDAYGARRRYDANFGTPTDDLKNTIAFTGQRLETFGTADTTLQVMCYKNRYYDPDTGRFLSRDPLGITPGVAKENPFGPVKQYTDGLSIYEYVKSSPTGFSDTVGLAMDWEWPVSDSTKRWCRCLMRIPHYKNGSRAVEMGWCYTCKLDCAQYCLSADVDLEECLAACGRQYAVCELIASKGNCKFQFRIREKKKK